MVLNLIIAPRRQADAAKVVAAGSVLSPVADDEGSGGSEEYEEREEDEGEANERQ